jgi:hypothetical protein
MGYFNIIHFNTTNIIHHFYCFAHTGIRNTEAIFIFSNSDMIVFLNRYLLKAFGDKECFRQRPEQFFFFEKIQMIFFGSAIGFPL